MIRRLIPILALLLATPALPLPAFAAEPPRLNAPGGEVKLPWASFEELYRRGVAPDVKPDPQAPREWTIDRAVYSGRAVGDGDDAHASFNATFRVEVLKKDGWTTIPLLSTNAALRAARIDGKDAAIFLQNGFYTLVTNRVGAFAVDVEFAVNLASADGETSFAMPVAASGATELRFTVPGADKVQPKVAGGKGVVVTHDGKETRVEAAIPSLGSLAVSWQRAVTQAAAAAAVVEPRVYAETHALVGVGEGVLQGSATVNYTVLHTGVDNFKVALPADVTVLDVQGTGIRDWTVGKDGVIAVALNFKALGAYRLTVDYERALGGASANLPLPRALAVAREKTWIGVDARSAVELVSGQAAGATPVDVRELPAAIVGRTDHPVLLAWKARGGEVNIPLEVRTHPDVDMLVTLLDTASADTLVTADGRRMTRVRYAVRNNRNQYLRLQLPTGAEVWSASVAGRGVKVAKGEGGVLVPLVRSGGAGGALAAFLVEIIYVEEGSALAKSGKAEAKLTLPRADAPASQLTWTVWFPADAKIDKKSHEGTVANVSYFSQAPQLPDNVVTDAAASGVMRQSQAQAAPSGALGSGVEPVKVDLPLSGQSVYYEKMLVLDEELWVSFDYARKPKK